MQDTFSPSVNSTFGFGKEWGLQALTILSANMKSAEEGKHAANPSLISASASALWLIRFSANLSKSCNKLRDIRVKN